MQQLKHTLILYTELVEHLDKLLVERLVAPDGLAQGHIDHLVVSHAHHDIALPLQYGLDSAYTRAAGKYPVAGRGTTSTLQMPQNRHNSFFTRSA